MTPPKPVKAWAVTRKGVVQTGFMWKIKRHALRWNDFGPGDGLIRVLITPIPPKRKKARRK